MNGDWKRLGASLIAIGGLIELGGIGYVLLTGTDVELGSTVLAAAFCLAAVATLGAVISGLAPARLPRVNAQAAGAGAVACLTANTLLLIAPPPSDDPLRTLFLGGIALIGASGVLALVVSVVKSAEQSETTHF